MPDLWHGPDYGPDPAVSPTTLDDIRHDTCRECGYTRTDSGDCYCNTWNATGCRACDYLEAGCPEHYAQAFREDRDWRLDRWCEALYGARLRFHATSDPQDPHGPDYWPSLYRAWQALYHGYGGTRIPGGYAYER